MSKNGKDNPYASPPVESAVPLTSVELGEQLGEADVVDMLAKKKPWKLLLFKHALRFEAGDDQPTIDISRTDFPDKTVIHDTLFMPRSLQVNIGKQKVFAFTVEDFAKLTEWKGPLSATDLKLALKRRMGWVFPFAIFFIITSLPLSGDPANGIEPLPFDPINCGLGVSLFIIAVAARWKPHRSIFLVDSVWMLTIACKTTYDIFGGLSWWWAILVFLQLLFVVSGIKEYRRFAAMRPDSGGEGSE